MSLAGIKLRSIVVHACREALLSRGFEEVIPQLMSQTQPLEPTIYPFKTQWNRQSSTKIAPMDQYLATSPESYLKQVMAKGCLRCFAISHAFRNLEGEGSLHRPEFLMAEWYEHNTDWLEMMRQTQSLVSLIWQQGNSTTDITTTKSWPSISYRDLWQEYLHHDLDALLAEDEMIQFAKARGYSVQNATWEQLFYQIVFNEIEPHFQSAPFFLIDFPARLSPLAKPQSNNLLYAERFELIINRIELANGNTENTNTETIRTMMKQEQQLRHTSMPLDVSFINSLAQLNNQSWAGVGLGLDRLSMLIGNISHIHDIQWP